MFTPPTPIKERILSFGGPGLGKSYDFYMIARRYVATNTPGKFFIIDTDNSIDRDLYTEFTDVQAAGIVVPYNATDWESLIDALESVVKQAGPTDWLMIDLLSPTWDYVQRWYTKMIFHKSRSEYMMQMRENMKPTDKNAPIFDGWKDWPFITGVYMEDLMMPLKQMRCHVYCTAEVKGLSDASDKETRAMYGAHGVLPVGQKRTGHSFKTTLWKQQLGEQYVAVTIRDNGRRDMPGKIINDFSIDYLRDVAGWVDSDEEEKAATAAAEKAERLAALRAKIAVKDRLPTDQ